jgi:hypothetical protein
MKKLLLVLLLFASTAFGLTEVKEYGLDKAAVVTTSDTANLPVPARMLWIGGAGNVKVDTVGGSTGITILAVAAGTRLPIQVKKVYATGTTATNIVALY